jgi:hypothetical protein
MKHRLLIVILFILGMSSCSGEEDLFIHNVRTYEYTVYSSTLVSIHFDTRINQFIVHPESSVISIEENMTDHGNFPIEEANQRFDSFFNLIRVADNLKWGENLYRNTGYYRTCVKI